MVKMECSGWWEQVGYGRQAMWDLQLTFTNGRIFGSGTDVVGPFEMNGELQEVKIYLLKQYIGRHAIEYHGLSIGEGAYSGTWSYHGYSGGKWFIAVIRHTGTTEDSSGTVQEID